jgi:hypothetical protein
MEKFIEVYDDILPYPIVEEIENILLSGDNEDFKWVYRPNISSNHTKNYLPGFSHVFHSYNPLSLTPFSYFFNQILYTFCNFQNLKLQYIFGGRTFLQLPIIDPSLASDIHTDLLFPHWVCLYYVNDTDGDTIFYDNNENEIKRVSPKKGRIAFFDGAIKHRGGIPSKNPRAVVNFDFIGEKL